MKKVFFVLALFCSISAHALTEADLTEDFMFKKVQACWDGYEKYGKKMVSRYNREHMFSGGYKEKMTLDDLKVQPLLKMCFRMMDIFATKIKGKKVICDDKKDTTKVVCKIEKIEKK